MSDVLISFDSSYNPELPSMVLMKRSGDVLGQLIVNGVVSKDQFTNPCEITFSINKEVDNLWNEVTDLRLIFCVEWNKVFEIKVDIEESTDTTKVVYCTELSQSELSQIMLYNNEYNTENDILRDNYSPTVLYNPDNPSASLLNRMLDKAPHYTIIHVDESIKNIQRVFSFDNISLYDALNQVAEEINCVFIYDNGIDEDGKIIRGISAYDLEYYCIECGHRDEYIDVCPKCGSDNILKGYGDDTTIFVTSDELASNIQLSTDVGSIKNCFKLEAGDDLMTATIRNCNPNGSDYIWYIPESTKKDMSFELVNKINSYDTLYNYYQNSCIYTLNGVGNYNNIVKKYLVYNKNLNYISESILGYQNLMNADYDTIDLLLYLESVLMPNAEMSDTTASEQLSKLTSKNMSPCAVTELKHLSNITADNVVMYMAKALTDARYRIDIVESSLVNNTSFYTWTGKFKVENYYNKEDVAIGGTVKIIINDDYKRYIEQKINAVLHSRDTTDLSVTGLFEMTDNEFKNELKKYCLDSLNTFHAACQSCLDALIEQGVSTASTWYGKTPNLYNEVYVPYYNKLEYIESEIKVREDEISVIKSVQDSIADLIIETKNELNFEKYIGSELWNEFITFRREDKFSNTNYISDGLTNSQLFENAREFIKLAQKEIVKSSERQHSITATLRNFLFMKKFEPIVKYFKVGNWIRIQIDDDIYKLRLLSYEVDFDNPENINVEFSDVIKSADGSSDQRSLIQKTVSMTTSYSSVQRQANKSVEMGEVISDWEENGIDTNLIKLSYGQEQMWDEHGMLFRKRNQYSDGFDNIQMKIINSTLSITDDNWKTTKTALGLFKYKDPVSGEILSAYGINGELISGKLLLGEQLGIYNESGSLTFDKNGFAVTNGVNIVTINPNEVSLFTIKDSDGSNIISFDDNGNGVFNGKIIADSGKFGGINIDTNKIYSDNNKVVINSNGSATFKDVSITGVQAGSSFGGISYGTTGTYGNLNGGFSAGTSFGLSGGALTDFDNLVANKVTANYISAAVQLDAVKADIEFLQSDVSHFRQVFAGEIQADTLKVNSANIYGSIVADQIRLRDYDGKYVLINNPIDILAVSSVIKDEQGKVTNVITKTVRVLGHVIVK